VDGPVHHQHTKLRFDSLFSRKIHVPILLWEKKINWIDGPNSNGKWCLPTPVAMKFCVWARMVGGRGRPACCQNPPV